MQRRGAAFDYVRGLLSAVERKNGWQLSEAVQRQAHDRIQHLLDRARWDADLLRDDLRDYVADELGAAGALRNEYRPS